jgi:hypothetical protein
MRRKKGGQIWPMAMYYPGHLGGSISSIKRQEISFVMGGGGRGAVWFCYLNALEGWSGP